jgi:hypothetical protein
VNCICVCIAHPNAAPASTVLEDKNEYCSTVYFPYSRLLSLYCSCEEYLAESLDRLPGLGLQEKGNESGNNSWRVTHGFIVLRAGKEMKEKARKTGQLKQKTEI